jgi:hypothetical protein
MSRYPLYNDPDGFKTCRKCKVLFILSHKNFSTNNAFLDKFNCICKQCDNYKRRLRYKTKVSHNIARRCKLCNAFFWEQLAMIRKGRGNYCSRKCSAMARDRSGYSYHCWNGKRRGSGNPASILNEEQVKQIKQLLLNDKLSKKEISERFNVSRTVIYRINSGRSWTHVTME